MPLELVTVGTLRGVEVHRPPVGGAVWDNGALLHLRGAEIDWQLPVEHAPPLAVAGRRLYMGLQDWIVCLDVRTGVEVWAADCGERVVALDAHLDGVDVLAGKRLCAFDPRGVPGDITDLPGPGHRIRRIAARRYVTSKAGIWRVSPGERPTLHYACACDELYVRDGALQAIAQGPTGTVLVEDDCLAMVWPFVDAASHHVAAWGRTDWVVAPRAGTNGLWWVDRRVQTLRQVALPGRTIAVAVVGATAAVLVDDAGPVLGLIHPFVSTPLLLELERTPASMFPGLQSEGPLLFLSDLGYTSIFHVRESS